MVDEEEEWQSYLTPERLEVLSQLEPWVEEHVLPLLQLVEASWQPADLLPDPTALGSDSFHAACHELLVCLRLTCNNDDEDEDEEMPPPEETDDNEEEEEDDNDDEEEDDQEEDDDNEEEEDDDDEDEDEEEDDEDDDDGRCRSTATASKETMAADRHRREKKGVVDEEEWRSYLTPERLEVLNQLEPWVKEHALPLLKPTNDHVKGTSTSTGNLGSDGFHVACLELRSGAAGVPDELLVCLVANMVTEEALPTYPSVLNRLEVVRDATGADGTAWARWIRGWSAEENRHGDVLNCYMHISGRFNLGEVERTVQRLIRDGMVVHAPASPFHGFVYVAFQERATAIAHGNTARLVGAHGAGDATLARICGTVAADEKRHEAAYTRIMGKLFEADPDAAVRAMAYMMRRRIDMPTAFINDGRHSGSDFSTRFIAIAQQAGTYTISDYRSFLEHLIRQWGVEELTSGLSGEGRHARDYLCPLPRARSRGWRRRPTKGRSWPKRIQRSSRSAGFLIGPSASFYPNRLILRIFSYVLR
ncbi:Acyl-[acyl-carrier-protein] desaturase 6, chloroplastic [Dichanthelium oligosanthes]|uniref:Acyl-[acyl-carrier-protein] desaturase 6, chloroplastic n=1 Tax=Dichanthelium oligosanthes TaxID=888268 RepID=A0A1E5WFE3_9POAL|nr:Acyl-[acyl-carrier-protein] desaturase 6, chloroplastic [Dichanthelium oligosanthes]